MRSDMRIRHMADIHLRRRIARELGKQVAAILERQCLARAYDALILIAPDVRRRAECKHLTIL